MSDVLSPRLRPPVSSDYYPSLLKALDTLTKRQPGVFVSHRDVTTLTIREMGYDPDNLAQYGDPDMGWRRGGAHAPPGMDRIIWFAMRNLSWRKKEPLCVYGPPDPNQGTKPSPTCLWGLTEAGVRSLPEKESAPTPNATSKFLATRLASPNGIQNSDLYRAMKTTLSRKLPVSLSSGQIEDHIQTCFQRLVSRDALKKWLATKGDVSNANLANFAVRSAFTDCRNSARNPICRTLYGARTEKELQVAAKEPEINCSGSKGDSKVARRTDNNDDVIYEIIDLNPTAEEEIMFAAIWEEIVETLKRKKPVTWKRYARVLSLRAAGNSLGEIKVKMKLSGNRAAVLLLEAREVLKQASRTDGFQAFNLSEPPESSS